MARPALEFHPEAVAEASAAREWYAARSQSAADRFVAELDRAIEQILGGPSQELLFAWRTGRIHTVAGDEFPVLLSLARCQMANTMIEPIHLRTFIGQIDQIMRKTAEEANGAVVANQPGESDRWDEMIKRLLALRNLQEDWDGMGAKAPQATLIDSALELARILRQHGFRPPSRVGAGPDGEILLEWQDNRLYLEAEVCAPHTAEWMFAIDDRPPKHWLTH